MSRVVILFFLLLSSLPALLIAQVRVSKLTIKAKEIFQLGSSDIIVADTLVMMDSSRINLNPLKAENYIRAGVAIIGKQCLINGKGVNGKKGHTGSMGKTSLGPCREGLIGRNGGHGLDGAQGTNLFLYIDKLIVNGSLVIDLSGGNGGDGGDGGEGGGGSPGTLHCYGGNGGAGGNAGNGGDGGRGGTLTCGGLDLDALRNILGLQITVNTLGGNFGYGGVEGAGGSAGLGPAKMDGKPGDKGINGDKGNPGENGSIQFEQQ